MEEHKNLIRNLISAWNDHNVEAAAACYAPDYRGRDNSTAGEQHGPAAVRQSLDQYLRAFPDLSFAEVESVVQGDHAAVRWIARGTHLGSLMNIPPTGRRIDICGSSFFTLSGGKIRRAVILWDVAGILREFGLLPEL